MTLLVTFLLMLLVVPFSDYSSELPPVDQKLAQLSPKKRYAEVIFLSSADLEKLHNETNPKNYSIVRNLLSSSQKKIKYWDALCKNKQQPPHLKPSE